MLDMINLSMALKATIFKADLNISDLDRHYYHSHNLTIAQHPSENDTRMMVRLLAFALNAHENLVFTKGLSTQDEPDLWQKSLSDEIELWIDLGNPDEKRIRQACGKAKQVIIYNYAGNSSEVWWQQIQPKLNRFSNLSVINIAEEHLESLSHMTRKQMSLTITIQDSELFISDESNSVQIEIKKRY